MKRTNFPIPISVEEKEAFTRMAKTLNWTLGKYIRVSSTMTYLMLTKKVESFLQAYEQALILDVDGRKKK